VLCRSCQFENPAGMRFCGQCGAPLALACRSCGAEAAPSFRFCGRCGAALVASPAASAAPPAPTAATPAWAASEEVHRVINGCFEVITAEVHRFEGTINQFTGGALQQWPRVQAVHETVDRLRSSA
jgi:Double zinc ribbon